MTPEYSPRFLINLYKTMVRIRLCEESLVRPILDGKVRCPVHLYTGEEAVATGVCAALTNEDCIFGTHRSHGHYLAKGGRMETLIAEMYGRKTGCSKGRGGSMHVIDSKVGMTGSTPIVAGTISLALGASLAASISKSRRVVVSFFGDGATGEGVLYESLNFAALRKLPLIFVCENNMYSTHLPIGECRPNNKIFKIAYPYGIRSFRVDGNNVLKVHQAAAEAVESCRKGLGPAFIECLTYRLRGHVGPDDNIQGLHTDIRPQEEIDRWRRKDPIKSFERFLLRNQVATKGELTKIALEVEREVEEAHSFAENSAFPKKHEVAWYVFK